MMFDVVKLRAELSFGNAEQAREFVFQIAHLRGIRQPIFRLPKHTQTRRGVQDLLVQVRRRIARDADMVHVLEPHARFSQTVTNRLLGETGAMLDAIETLFFRRGDQSAVFDDCRCSIAVIRVDAEDVHRESSK